MRLSPIPVSDGVSISSRLFFYPCSRNIDVYRDEQFVFCTRYGEVRNRDIVLHDCLGFGSHTAQQRRQAHTKYFLCDVLIHSLCVLESVYQINRGLCGAEVMMSLVFGDFFTTGGARIAVVAGVNVSDTDFRFQIPVSS